MNSKNITITEAVAQIKNGDSVAVGGSGLRRPPAAALHEVIRQKKKEFNNTWY